MLAAGSRPSEASVTPRLHWIDWHGVAAVGGVFLFRTLRPFNADDWHVSRVEQNTGLSVVAGVFWSFGLAVLFLMSGIGARSPSGPDGAAVPPWGHPWRSRLLLSSGAWAPLT